MNRILALLRRELALTSMGGGGALMSLGFYAASVTLVPLSSGAALDRLPPLAIGIAWVGLTLSSLLSLERLFDRDLEDGTLDQLSLGRVPLELVCLIKCLAQWLGTGLPLALAAPVAAVALGAPPAIIPLLALTSLAGSLAFCFLGGLGASLALGSRRGGVLIAVIVLPLDIPPVIFGASAVQALASGMPWSGGLVFLLAYTAFAVALAPVAMAAACRNALD